ncbi:MAG: multiple sugar transport system permease protein, partial [Glaciecola sp.]
GGQFTGLANVRRALSDPQLASALRASLIHASLAVPLRLIAAVGFALALAAPRRGSRWARAAVYLPSVLPELSLALIALWAFNPVFGPVNGALAQIGVSGPNWFATAWGARIAVVAMMLLPIGEGFLVALAARRSLSAEVYEAARVDGASPWQQLRLVTLPQLAPLLVLLAVRDTILTLQVSVVPAYALTDGGPDGATLFLPIYIYDQAFELLGFGYGALLTLVLLVVTAVLVGFQVAVARRRHWW